MTIGGNLVLCKRILSGLSSELFVMCIINNIRYYENAAPQTGILKITLKDNTIKSKRIATIVSGCALMVLSFKVIFNQHKILIIQNSKHTR